jgi:hypothetical protein
MDSKEKGKNEEKQEKKEKKEKKEKEKKIDETAAGKIENDVALEGTKEQFLKFQKNLFHLLDTMPILKDMEDYWNSNKAFLANMAENATEYVPRGAAEAKEEGEANTEAGASEGEEEEANTPEAEDKGEANTPEAEDKGEANTPEAEDKGEAKEVDSNAVVGGKTRGKSKMKKYHFGRKFSRKRKRI